MTSNHLILCLPLILCPQSFSASGSFAVSWLFASGSQSTGMESHFLPNPGVKPRSPTLREDSLLSEPPRNLRIWELDHKEGWALKNWCFQTMVLEKTLESPLDYKEIKPVNRKGNQSWIVTGRTDAEAEAPILCPPDAKSQLTAKDPDAGKDWGQ